MLNPIVETVTGLVFIYLLLSMLCSTIQEWIAAMLALRATTLEAGVRSMLSNDADLVDRIYAHPLIRGLSRDSWWNRLWGMKRRPSYISSQIFAKALLAESGVTVGVSGAPQMPKAGGGANPISAETEKLLDTLVSFAPGEIDKLANSVAEWYDDAMDRVSGWYRRRVQIILLVIGAILAIGLNVDTIMLASAFWHDPTLRAATVDAAAQYVKTHKNEVDKLRAQQYPSTTASTTPTNPPSREKQGEDATQNLTNTIADVQSQINKLNIPFGWGCVDVHAADTSRNSPNPSSKAETTQRSASGKSPCVWAQHPSLMPSSLFLKLLGLLATILAISQGAPFWFDLLQKLVNVRLAGNPPHEKVK